MLALKNDSISMRLHWLRDSRRWLVGVYASFTMKQKTSRTYFRSVVASPVGDLRLLASDAGLAAVLWRDDIARHLGPEALVENGEHPVLAEAGRQLREYFARNRQVFELPLEFVGTDFQRAVWAALLTIPYGETRTYAQIAAQVGNPVAVRAVGAANGRNPISIIAPCHRVIGANGDLTGFGGGLDNKAFLLALESSQTDMLSAPRDSSAPSAQPVDFG
jgi:methylated-DNA-[protein]-cysteine S-methyltransferase